jgi:hypothetical protein
MQLPGGRAGKYTREPIPVKRIVLFTSESGILVREEASSVSSVSKVKLPGLKGYSGLERVFRLGEEGLLLKNR